MFLVRTRSIPVLLLRLLQHSKPHSPSNLRTQTIRNRNTTNILSNRFQHTITPTVTQTADHVQDRKSFPVDSPIKPEQSISSSSDANRNDQANRLQQQAGPEYFKPLEEEPTTRAINKWRKAYGEWARVHKENKNLQNDILKYKGRTSYDWYIPLRLLERQFLKQNDGPEERPNVESVSAPKRPKLRQLHVDQIKQPPAWSISTFCDYIEDLTKSRVDILMQRQFYANGDSHNAAVGRRLQSVFYDPSVREFLSPQAFNLALSFFFRTHTLPPALALFEYMMWLWTEIPVDTAHIMLRGAASCNDLSNFTRLLILFINRGVSLTGGAWTSLAMTVQSRKARAVIIMSMRERKLLEIFSAMRDIAHIITRDEMIRHLQSKLDVASFLTYMDSQFGTEWLSVTAGNIMLYEIGQRRPILEAIGTLDILKERGMVADAKTLNTLLTMCRWDRDHLLAIEVVRKLKAEHRVKPDELAYQILFQQAWRSRLYNFATVVWRSACIEGLASFEIRDLVKGNLQRTTACLSEDRPESRAHVWSVSAGEVIVGIDQSEGIYDILFPDSGDTVEPSVLTKTLRSARDWIVMKDIAAAGRYRLVDDLAALLLRALQLDRSWMESGAWNTQSARWKRENSLPVLMERVKLRIRYPLSPLFNSSTKIKQKPPQRVRNQDQPSIPSAKIEPKPSKNLRIRNPPSTPLEEIEPKPPKKPRIRDPPTPSAKIDQKPPKKLRNGNPPSTIPAKIDQKSPTDPCIRNPPSIPPTETEPKPPKKNRIRDPPSIPSAKNDQKPSQKLRIQDPPSIPFVKIEPKPPKKLRIRDRPSTPSAKIDQKPPQKHRIRDPPSIPSAKNDQKPSQKLRIQNPPSTPSAKIDQKPPKKLRIRKIRIQDPPSTPSAKIDQKPPQKVRIRKIRIQDPPSTPSAKIDQKPPIKLRIRKLCSQNPPSTPSAKIDQKPPQKVRIRKFCIQDTPSTPSAKIEKPSKKSRIRLPSPFRIIRYPASVRIIRYPASVRIIRYPSSLRIRYPISPFPVPSAQTEPVRWKRENSLPVLMENFEEKPPSKPRIRYPLSIPPATR